jgi:hypothetical protein
MNLSIILPFYHKLEEFKYTLPYNKQFFVDGMELIIPVDEPDSEDNLRKFLDGQNIKIPYIIRSNKVIHEWRNPSKAINVGIRLSSREKVIVMSPETICVNNLYEILYNECNEDNFSIGNLHFVKITDIPTFSTSELELLFDTRESLRIDESAGYYGSICVHKKNLERIQGYNENFYKWGFDDDDVRKRLMRINLNKTIVRHAKALHIEIKSTRPETQYPLVLNSKIPFTSQPQWGMDF